MPIFTLHDLKDHVLSGKPGASFHLADNVAAKLLPSTGRYDLYLQLQGWAREHRCTVEDCPGFGVFHIQRQS